MINFQIKVKSFNKKNLYFIKSAQPEVKRFTGFQKEKPSPGERGEGCVVTARGPFFIGTALFRQENLLQIEFGIGVQRDERLGVNDSVDIVSHAGRDDFRQFGVAFDADHNNKVIFAGNAVYLGHPLDLHEIFDDAANHGALDVDQNNACNHLHNLLWVVAGGPPMRPPPSLTITTTSGIANRFLTKSGKRGVFSSKK